MMEYPLFFLQEGVHSNKQTKAQKRHSMARNLEKWKMYCCLDQIRKTKFLFSFLWHIENLQIENEAVTLITCALKFDHFFPWLEEFHCDIRFQILGNRPRPWFTKPKTHVCISGSQQSNILVKCYTVEGSSMSVVDDSCVLLNSRYIEKMSRKMTFVNGNLIHPMN